MDPRLPVPRAQVGVAPQSVHAVQPSYQADPVNAADYPFVVAFFRAQGEDQVCAGSLIEVDGMESSERGRWVLSAAHCGAHPAFGVAGLDQPATAPRKWIAVEGRWFRPGFSCDSAQNDVALYRLQGPAGNGTIKIDGSASAAFALLGREDEGGPQEYLALLRGKTAWSAAKCQAYWEKASYPYDASGGTCLLTTSKKGEAWVTAGDSGGPVVSGQTQFGVTLASNVLEPTSTPAMAVVRPLTGTVLAWVKSCVLDPKKCRTSPPQDCGTRWTQPRPSR